MPQLDYCPNLELGQVESSNHRCPNLTIAPVWNWGNLDVRTTGAPTWPLPWFGIGASWKFEPPVPQLDSCPNSKLGQIWSLEHWCPSLLMRLNPWCPNFKICPNSKLGQNLELGHHGPNLKFAPIPNWDNQIDQPKSIQNRYPTWGKFEVGAQQYRSKNDHHESTVNFSIYQFWNIF